MSYAVKYVSVVCSGVSESVLCSEIPQYPKDGYTDGDREDMDAASVLEHMDLSRECKAKAVW